MAEGDRRPGESERDYAERLGVTEPSGGGVTTGAGGTSPTGGSDTTEPELGGRGPARLAPEARDGDGGGNGGPPDGGGGGGPPGGGGGGGPPDVEPEGPPDVEPEGPPGRPLTDREIRERFGGFAVEGTTGREQRARERAAEELGLDRDEVTFRSVGGDVVATANLPERRERLQARTRRLDRRVDERAGFDAEPGEDFTIERRGGRLVASGAPGPAGFTPTSETGLGAAPRRATEEDLAFARTGVAGPQAGVGGESPTAAANEALLRRGAERLEEETGLGATAADVELTAGGAAPTRGFGDRLRRDAEGELLRQLRDDTGADLGRADIRFTEEDGRVSAELTESGRRKVSVERAELVETFSGLSERGDVGAVLEGTEQVARAGAGAAFDIRAGLGEASRDLQTGFDVYLPTGGRGGVTVRSPDVTDQAERLAEAGREARELADEPTATARDLADVEFRERPLEPPTAGEALAAGAAGVAAPEPTTSAAGAVLATAAAGALAAEAADEAFLPDDLSVPDRSEPVAPPELDAPEEPSPVAPPEIEAPERPAPVAPPELEAPERPARFRRSELSVPDPTERADPLQITLGGPVERQEGDPEVFRRLREAPTAEERRRVMREFERAELEEAVGMLEEGRGLAAPTDIRPSTPSPRELAEREIERREALAGREPFVAERTEGRPLSPAPEGRVASRAPDLARSGPTGMQREAFRSSFDVDDELSPRERMLEAQEEEARAGDFGLREMQRAAREPALAQAPVLEADAASLDVSQAPTSAQRGAAPAARDERARADAAADMLGFTAPDLAPDVSRRPAPDVFQRPTPTRTRTGDTTQGVGFETTPVTAPGLGPFPAEPAEATPTAPGLDTPSPRRPRRGRDDADAPGTGLSLAPADEGAGDDAGDELAIGYTAELFAGLAGAGTAVGRTTREELEAQEGELAFGEALPAFTAGEEEAFEETLDVFGLDGGDGL